MLQKSYGIVEEQIKARAKAEASDLVNDDDVDDVDNDDDDDLR